MNPWLETIGVILVALLGALFGMLFSRFRKPYWAWGYFLPTVLIAMMLIVPFSFDCVIIFRCSARSPTRLGLDKPDVTRATTSMPCTVSLAIRNESIEAAVIMPTMVPLQPASAQYFARVISGASRDAPCLGTRTLTR